LNTLGIIIDHCSDEVCKDPTSDTLTVTLIVTQQCNFRCSYCYEKFKNLKLSDNSYRSIFTFIKKQMESNEFKNVRINLFGGEPLLVYNDIISFLESLNAYLKTKKINFSIGMTTNGYLLDIEKYKTLVDLGLTDVQVTLDGFSKTHNKTRHLANREGTWNVIIQNLKKISQYPKHSKIILRTNFNSEVIESEKKFLIFCKDYFENQFIMHFEAIKPFNKNYKGECYDQEKEHENIIKLIQFCKHNQINHIFKDVLSRGFYACPQCSKNSYVFDPELNLMKCTVLFDFDKNQIGRLNSDGKLIINNNINLWNGYTESCKECNVYPVCLGRKCLGGALKNKKPKCSYDVIVKSIKDIVCASYD
ncbi:radical SAM protein, partial [Faecalicoccus pleomorphus]